MFCGTTVCSSHRLSYRLRKAPIPPQTEQGFYPGIVPRHGLSFIHNGIIPQTIQITPVTPDHLRAGIFRQNFFGLMSLAQRVIILPSTGLYSDVPSADKPHETESIGVTTILIIPIHLSSHEANFHCGFILKKHPHKTMPPLRLSDDDVAPVWELSHRGATSGEVKPLVAFSL